MDNILRYPDSKLGKQVKPFEECFSGIDLLVERFHDEKRLYVSPLQEMEAESTQEK